ncbi:MAG: Crp/Fnr family transcriptional regulator [Deltaproteobacteria bacterium]|nr:Crp/Fnr family transcriptional regulator [Deltaproteobacteria bacterium]
MNPLALLKQIPLFGTFQPADHEQLAGLLRRRNLKKGDVLFRKGDEGTALYIIIKGRMKITVPSKLGDEITLAILSQGDFFGEMALLDSLPRSADATAVEETLLYVLNRSDFLSFLINNENAVRSILYALSSRLRKTDDFLTEVCFLNISARLARRLLEMSESLIRENNPGASVELKLTLKDLASLLGTTRETINRELKILRDRGIVSTSRNLITIHNLELLKRCIK